MTRAAIRGSRARSIAGALAGLLSLAAAPLLAQDAGTPAAAPLFAQRCSGCHGPDGAGPARKHLRVQLPDLRAPAWQAAHSDAQIRAVIAEGVPRRMPAFKDRLSAEEIASLTALIRSFAP